MAAFVGIDLGSSALKVVALRRALGRFKVLAAIRRRGPDGAPALPSVLGAPDGRRIGVVGLSGRDINLQLVRQPVMKALNYRVMMGYELDQRRSDAPDFYVDFCTLREPDSYFPQYLALVGMGKKDYVDERIETLRRASVDVRDAVPNALALYAVYRNSYPVEGGVTLLLDVGAENMDLAFVRGGKLLFARNVSSGARVFDANIAGMVEVAPEEAEVLKVTQGRLTGGSEVGEDSREARVRAAVRTAAGQLVGFVSSSVNHARLQLSEKELVVDRVYVSGGGARLRGLPEYMAGALKIPVEPLDPCKGLDLSPLGAEGAEEFRKLPSDMAVAVGLAELAAAPSRFPPLSILPPAMRRRRDFFRTTFWLIAGGIGLAAAVIVAAALTGVRTGARERALQEFRSKTADIHRRTEAFEAAEAAQRDVGAKIDYLDGSVAGGRGVVEAMATLRKVLPAGVMLRSVKVAERRVEHQGWKGDGPRRAAFIVRKRGVVTGEIESESEEQIKLVGVADPILKADVQGEIVRWPSAAGVLRLAGEVDENIPGGPREALNALRDKLSDPARGVSARVERQDRADKPGWRTFEILVSFE